MLASLYLKLRLSFPHSPSLLSYCPQPSSFLLSLCAIGRTACRHSSQPVFLSILCADARIFPLSHLCSSALGKPWPETSLWPFVGRC
ncbi:hypothetical protein F2Q69_00033575 [Brassica cretica]|uniref:Uncharacterized protein n=1 Tax=Brassica cretica TaxID=69181 RepID=A0A8S9SEM6_BRACR|nr:hypothetical protein F2Q69_00033575 [Brassica cretica]